MKLMFRAILVNIILLLGINYAAQDSSYLLKLTIHPGHTFQIRINDEAPIQESRIFLPKGDYKLSIWAPEFRVFDTLIQMGTLDTLKIIKKLDIPADFIEHQRIGKQISLKHHLIKTIPTILSFIALGNSTIKYFGLRKKEKAVIAVIDLYNRSGSQGDLLLVNNNFNAFNLDYEDSKKAYYKSLYIAGGTLFVTAISYYLSSKIIIPIYNDKAKIQFLAEPTTMYNTAPLELGFSGKITFKI